MWISTFTRTRSFRPQRLTTSVEASTQSVNGGIGRGILARLQRESLTSRQQSVCGGGIEGALGIGTRNAPSQGGGVAG